MSWRPHDVSAFQDAEVSHCAIRIADCDHRSPPAAQTAAKQAAQFWRFGPKAFKSYYNVVDPGKIEQRADAETPLEEVLKSWAVGTDPAIHVNAVRELFDSGASIVNIHSGQPDQRKVIEFYGSHVLPKFRQPI